VNKAMYKSLDYTRKQLRFIALLSGSKTERIECRLITGSFGNDGKWYNEKHTRGGRLTSRNQVKYSALSYVWGSTDEEQAITLDGQNFLIRKNLWSALLYLRSTSEPNYMWIDAICINQADQSERSHQVGFMKDIFESAEAVRVWLGEATNDTFKAFQLLKDATGQDQNREFWSHFLQNCGVLTALLSRTYWERIWIVQDYAVARQITIHCGDYSCRGAVLENMLHVVDSAYQHYTVSHRFEGRAFRESELAALLEICQSPGVAMLRQQKAHKNPGSNRILLNLIEYYKYCKATDQRDKVYALLGLASDTQCNEFPIDYAKPVSEVMDDVLEFYRSKEL
jgi:hypothetical protein